MNRCKGDDSFGPSLRPGLDCYNFDLTIFFEECIFNTVPSVLATLAATFRLYGLVKEPKIIAWPLARTWKQGLFVLLAVLQVILTALWSCGYGVHTRLTIPASVVTLVAILTLYVLSNFEHSRALRPSLIIQVYFFSTVLLDLARLRTQWLLVANTPIASITTAIFAVKIVTLVVESVPKYQHSTVAMKKPPPLETCGIFGRALLLWLNPLFMLGYRKNLEIDDLFPLESDLAGKHLTNRLEAKWKTANKSKKHCLTNAVMTTFLPEIVLSWIPRSFHIAFSIAQPYLVQTTLNYIMRHSTLPVSYGYGLIGAYGIVYTGAAISNQLFNFLCFRLMVKIRGALVGIIYCEMLALRAESKNSSSAMTLMSTDVDRITMTARWVLDLIPNIGQLAIALWILSLQLGSVAVAPVIVALLCAGCAAGMAKVIPIRQRKWIAAIQKRVGITSELLSAMKGVKMIGISVPISKQIQELRDFEVSESKKFRKLQIGVISLNIIPMMSMSAVTFTVFAIVAKVSGSGALGITQAFTSLSLLGLLIMPVALLVSSLSKIAEAMACLDRIQDFLLLEKRSDFRTTGTTEAATHAPEDGLSTTVEKSEDDPNHVILAVRNGSFAWDADSEKPILTDINISVRASELVLVVGPVASGKSTLLKGFLGEVYLRSGSVHILDPDNVAYCDQDAWILNQSIRDNIVAFSDYDEKLYNSVIKACQLKEDLSYLPKGDLSQVGSQGISLSGGQKQRIALARAFYSRKGVIIMDDTMKGLDADTSTSCFRALMGKNGLMQTNRTTVIMATHNAQWFQYADRLIVLGSDGRVASIGSFADLKKPDDYVKNIQASYRDEFDDNTEHFDQESQSTEGLSKQSAKISDTSQSDPETAADEKMEKLRGNINSSLPYYVKSLMNFSFILFCILMVLQTVFRVIQPLWLNFWTTANAKNPNEDPGKWVGIYVLFSVLNLGGMISQFTIFLIRIVPESAKTLHWRILEVTMRAPMSYFVATDVGQLINRFSQDMTLVDFPLPIALMQSLEMFIAAIGEIILTCVSSGYLAIVIPLLFVVLFGIQRFYLQTSRQLRLLDLESKSPLYSFFISSFSGLTTIRGFAWTKKSFVQHIEHLDISQRPFYLLYCAQRWLLLVLELLVAGLSVLLVGLSVALRDRVAPGLLGVALTNVTSFGQTISQFIIFWTDLETSLGAITRVREFVAETPMEKEGAGSLPDSWPSEGSISVSGLTAKFGDHVVLDDINLDIRGGEKVAICGRTGSGKSTVIALLLRLYDPIHGTIEIDGIDISTLRINLLRESLVALPQDPLLLAGTVRYNLDPSLKTSDDAMLLALEKTGIRAAIEDKGGLDADLQTEWLSAGQKQLFCLARAMLRKSRILLLDEATSSLDHQTDELIQDLIRKEFAGWTILVIAHRLKTITDFDKVAVLQDGRIAEFDSPFALLERGSLFKSLWDLQEH